MEDAPPRAHLALQRLPDVYEAKNQLGRSGWRKAFIVRSLMDFGGLKTARNRIRDQCAAAASRTLLRSRMLSLFSWPQAAMMSSPRGVRTGEA